VEAPSAWPGVPRTRRCACAMRGCCAGSKTLRICRATLTR